MSIGHIKERLAEEKCPGETISTSSFDSLKKEIFRVNELINNFLFLGKPITLKREWISADALAEDALYMVRDKIREGISVTFVSPDEGMRVYCDREYMRICLINLILNSAQAIEDKGSITVRFGHEDVKCLHFSQR